jgi:two-component system, OmpR family, sensor kinase
MSKLYWRIWLTVAASIVVLTVLVAWSTRAWVEYLAGDATGPGMGAQPPMRELSLRNAQGLAVASSVSKPVREIGKGMVYSVEVAQLPAGTYTVTLGPPVNAMGERVQQRWMLGPGGIALPVWMRQTGGLAVLVAFIAIAVAVGTYPIVRRLTQRLDGLRASVQAFGEGQLHARADVGGDDDVAFLAQQFNESAQRIERLVTAQKDLLAHASHELRSPLARMRMALEIWQTDPSEAMREELQRNMRELDELVEELLLAARLQAGTIAALPRERVTLSPICIEECQRTQTLGVLPETLKDVAISGQAKYVRRMVRNLLENAQRHGQAQVELALIEHQDQLHIQVQDRGPGIPPDERERVFEAFYRVRGTSEAAGGVGLGLSLVKQLAQSMGGDVRCTDRPDGQSGACFVLSLPRQSA